MTWSSHSGARSSAGEHYLDMVGVTGSIPVAPTIQSFQTADLGAGSKVVRLCGDFRWYQSALSVSGDTCGLSGRFSSSRLCIQKFRSRARVSTDNIFLQPGIWESWEAKTAVSSSVRNYREFSPRASNCWLHSAGASRSRSTPTPRGKRPSTAARTRSGARNASEIVMLT